MADQISLTGFISSEIETVTLDSGVVLGKFRMGSNTRRFDKPTNQWVDGTTNWFHVTVWREIASNTVVSLHKGDRILLVGKLKVGSYVRKDGAPGTSVEIEAESIGPDLKFGKASFHRTSSARSDTQGGNWQGTGAPSAQQYRNGDDEEGEFPPDTDENAADADDPNQGGGSADGDLGGQAAALEVSANGLRAGEGVNEDTGEIVEESVPF